MSLANSLDFASDFINNRSGAERTPERLALIERLAFDNLNLKKTCSCPDWYLDTLMKLLNIKDNTMNYKLKPGAILFLPFHSENLTVSQFNLTETLAILHLAKNPKNAVFFEKYPQDAEGNPLLPSREELIRLGEDNGVSFSEAELSSLYEKKTVIPNAEDGQKTKEAKPTKEKAAKPAKAKAAKQKDEEAEKASGVKASEDDNSKNDSLEGL